MASPNKLLNARQLADSERSLKIGHAIVEPQHNLFIIPGPRRYLFHFRSVAGDAMSPQKRQFSGELRRTCGQATTFTCRNDLHWVKTEHGDVAVPTISHNPIGILSPDRMRGIFDDPKPVTLREVRHRGHITRLPSKMDRDNNFRQAPSSFRLLQFPRQRLHTHIASRYIDVHEADCGTAIQCTVCTSDKCVGSGPNSIVRTHIKCQTCKMECRRRTTHNHTVRYLAIASHCLLQTRDGRPLGDPIRAEHRCDCLNVFFRNRLSILPLRSAMTVRMSPTVASSSINREMIVVEETASMPRARKMCSFFGLLTRATARGTPNATFASWQATRLSSSSPVAATKTSALPTPA